MLISLQNLYTVKSIYNFYKSKNYLFQVCSETGVH